MEGWYWRSSLCGGFGLRSGWTRRWMLFKRHAPYHESDHVLALAYTLYADGTCLEDQAALQGSEAVRRLVGACRIPDPTTAGDFLRRFRTAQDVEQLSGVIDEVQEAVWSKLPRRVRRRRKKHEYALVDLDGHMKPLYGVQKEGADFSYDGRWSYQPLVVSLGGSGECLKVVNQPGSARSSDAAAKALKEVLPLGQAPFSKRHRARGYATLTDPMFSTQPSMAGAYFAIGGRLYPNRAALVEAIAEQDWKPFIPRADREEQSGASRHGRTANYRQQKAEERGFRTLRTVKQWVSEIAYQPAGLDSACRMIVRRILIEENDGQGALFEHFRYRLVLTNLPRSYTARAGCRYYLSALRPGKRHRAIRSRDRGMAHAGGGVYGQLGLAPDRPAGLESRQMDRPDRLAPRGGALGVEAISPPLCLHRGQGIKEGRSLVVRLAGSHRYLPDILTAHARLQT